MGDTDQAPTIAIDGIADPAVEAAVQRRIRDVCREAGVTGPLIIALATSDIRGRWDFVVKSATRRHLASFSAPLDHVADVLADHLRRVLTQIR